MNRTIRILVVDDDIILRKLVADQLSRSGFEASAVGSGEEALNSLRATDCDVVLLDIKMPGLSGLDTLQEIRKLPDPPEVVMLTADTSLSAGIEAMRIGAYDYLTKPSKLDQIEAVVRKADEKRRLVRQNASLRAAVRAPLGTDDTSPPIKYKSAAMRGVLELAESASRLDSTVIITGESGTGKDVVMRYIHSRSSRAELPIITVNCGALPEALFESEFFGHERGAFTGANTLKRGLIEAADGSTLFLDEIGEMPLLMQVKLLHFLEQGGFRRVGSTRDQTSDVRIVAATNRRLAEDIREGRFRADLFYRLHVVSIHIPPLRERPDDIPDLIDYFLELYRRRFNRPRLDLSTEARRRLSQYEWPGNVRELRNCIERATALSAGDQIEAHQVLPLRATDARPTEIPSVRETKPLVSPDGNPVPLTLEELGRRHILSVLSLTEGNRDRAAAILGISARTLYRKLREYDEAVLAS